MARKPSPALTDAEARVMDVLWQKKTATVADVVAGLKKKRAVTYSTAQTMLRILETKGYVAHDKVARALSSVPWSMPIRRGGAPFATSSAACSKARRGCSS